VVLSVLLRAANKGKKFKVIVTEARPDQIGYTTAKRLLQEANVSVSVVMDTAVAHIMDKVDMVILGAEGIVENGGIINKVRPLYNQRSNIF
jgi:translation initiation factor eIF-2B subunit alpha